MLHVSDKKQCVGPCIEKLVQASRGIMERIISYDKVITH